LWDFSSVQLEVVLIRVRVLIWNSRPSTLVLSKHTTTAHQINISFEIVWNSVSYGQINILEIWDLLRPKSKSKRKERREGLSIKPENVENFKAVWSIKWGQNTTPWSLYLGKVEKMKPGCLNCLKLGLKFQHLEFK